MNIKIKLPSTQPRKTRNPKAVQAFQNFCAEKFNEYNSRIVVHVCPIEALIAQGVIVTRAIIITNREGYVLRTRGNYKVTKEKITHIKIKL